MRYSDRFSVALTAGIGCGKTTATDYFTELGGCVIDADDASRSLTADGQPTVNLLADTFGKEILKTAAVLDRNKLREVVFNDSDKKRELETILHPLIRKQMQKLAEKVTSSYIIFSIPLLIETGQQNAFDRIVVIDTPDKQRIKWIKMRSGLESQEIRQIINSQASREARLEAADDVINNDDTLEHLYQQVTKLHHLYLRLSNS